MGGKGGGGGASNSQSIQIQQQAANEARYKEMLREQRLKEGTDAINALYDPTPIMETRHRKEKVGAGNLPAGKFFARAGAPAADAAGTPGTAATEGYWTGGDDRSAGTFVPGTPGKSASAPGTSATGFDEAGYLARYPGLKEALAPTGTTAQQHYNMFGKSENRYDPNFTYDPANPNQIVDEKGNVIGASADPNAQFDAEWDETVDTGKKKDRFQDLYDRYETGQRDFYMPELEKQYGDARKKAYLAHAGAGTLWSSMRGDTEADINSQNTLNKGQIESQIQDSLGGLRRQIASDKSSLINQLYATENPEMAANEALARTKTISQQTPPLSPMGDLFKIAAIGLGNTFGASNNDFNRVRYGGVGSTSSGANRPA